MGRYKRHARTKTVVEPNFKITHTVSSEEKKKLEKDTTVTEFIRDFTYSLKENGKFSNFIWYYAPFDKVFYNKNILPLRAASKYGIFIPIGENIRIRKKACLEVNLLNLYKTFLGKIALVDELLAYSNVEKKVSLKHLEEHYDEYSKKQLIEDYARYCVEKSGMKVYPNHLIFSLGFGLLFAIIGYLAFTFLLATTFGNLVAFGYGLCVLFVSSELTPLKR